jgi:hypothetical protein
MRVKAKERELYMLSSSVGLSCAVSKYQKKHCARRVNLMVI